MKVWILGQTSRVLILVVLLTGLCASTFLSEKWGYNSIYLIGLLGVLSEFMNAKCLEQYVARRKCCVRSIITL